MRAAAVPRTEITIGRGTVAVRQDELDKLLKALAALDAGGRGLDRRRDRRVAGRGRADSSAADGGRGRGAARRDRRRRADLAFPGSSLARLKALLDD